MTTQADPNDSAHHHEIHGDVHAIGRGATIALVVFITLACLLGIYAGLIIGEHATL
jgi:hypothetical protein